jgi:hypothetical protein
LIGEVRGTRTGSADTSTVVTRTSFPSGDFELAIWANLEELWHPAAGGESPMGPDPHIQAKD